MSEYNVIVFSCIVGYKIRLRVSRYSRLAIYPATPNVNTYKQGGPDVLPYSPRNPSKVVKQSQCQPLSERKHKVSTYSICIETLSSIVLHLTKVS